VQTPISSDSLMATDKQPRMDSALFPEMDTAQHGVQDGIEKRLVLEADSISSDAPDERRKRLIPWSNLIRCLEVVGTGGAIEQHLVQAVDLAETDAWRNVEAILGCGFDSARDESGALGLPQEALPELLNYNIETEQTLADPDFLEQKRPKGKVLKFEVPPHNAGSASSQFGCVERNGTPAKMLEFRRPESFN
jgi:hypothetical protein